MIRVPPTVNFQTTGAPTEGRVAWESRGAEPLDGAGPVEFDAGGGRATGSRLNTHCNESLARLGVQEPLHIFSPLSSGSLTVARQGPVTGSPAGSVNGWIVGLVSGAGRELPSKRVDRPEESDGASLHRPCRDARRLP